jgi:hypothetical protein
VRLLLLVGVAAPPLVGVAALLLVRLVARLVAQLADTSRPVAPALRRVRWVRRLAAFLAAVPNQRSPAQVSSEPRGTSSAVVGHNLGGRLLQLVPPAWVVLARAWVLGAVASARLVVLVVARAVWVVALLLVVSVTL